MEDVMGDAITFKDVRLPESFTTKVRKDRILSGATCDLLNVVFNNGGYIAGGFGTICARFYLGLQQEELGLFGSIKEHLGSPSLYQNISFTSRNNFPFRNAGCGDIDVWFPTLKQLSSFMHDPRREAAVFRGDV